MHHHKKQEKLNVAVRRDGKQEGWKTIAVGSSKIELKLSIGIRDPWEVITIEG